MTPPEPREVGWLGLDGARGGWAAAALTDDGRCELRLVGTVSEALARWPGVRSVLVDMPIGLPDGPERRRCDVLARRILPGRRSSSVFAPPCREALSAPDHAAANRINRRVAGRGLSIQAWHLAPRIRELDELLDQRKELRHIVLESHPEVLFTLLANDSGSEAGPLPAKRSPEGARRRRGILEAHLPGACRLLDEVAVPRGKAASDDWVDALVLGIVARRERGGPPRLPEPPEVDGTGIPMALALPSSQRRLSKE